MPVSMYSIFAHLKCLTTLLSNILSALHKKKDRKRAQRGHKEGRKGWIFCMKSYEKSKNKIEFLQFPPFPAVTHTNRIWSHDPEVEMYISALKCLDHLATPCIYFYNAWLCIALVPVQGAAACPGFASCALLNLAPHLVSSGTVPFSQMDLKRVQATRRFPWFLTARSGQVLNIFVIL